MILLKIGSQGEAVEQVQGGLNHAGASIYPALETDGVFGGKTHARVVEFQGKNGLAKDGIVGQQTQGALEKFVEAFLAHIKTLTPPADEQAARDRILDIARQMYERHGWRMSDQLGEDRQRIAMNYQADSKTKERQGGAILAQIAMLTGNPGIQAQNCFHISDAHVQRYAAALPPTDIGKWCGAFVFAVYKLAGLKIGFWPMVSTAAPKFGKTTLFTTVTKASDVKPGDYGIANWGKDPVTKKPGENHHFLVVKVNGDQLTTIEGNVNFRVNDNFAPLTIVKRDKYSIHGIMKDPQGDSGFGRPIWSKVL
ncbi:peptidoglycan-binding domain-containing protein [Roseibium sp.]|uniref:peptidoglycan-binding domain-containing protein n=1 Tax=Roseibium sp. TaxID=1936156 RepID=UPI003B511590